MNVNITHKNYSNLICVCDIENFDEFIDDFRTRKYDYHVDSELKEISTHISNYNTILKDFKQLKKYYDYTIKIDEELSDVIFEVRSLDAISNVTSTLKESGFKRELKSFQLRNLEKLIKKNIGADFSVPGGGKTSVALSYFSLLRNTKSKLLVVCPKNAMLAWDEDLPECFDDSIIDISNHKDQNKFIRIHEPGTPKINSEICSKKIFFIITYTQLEKYKKELTEFLIKNDIFLFLDESHRIKRGDEGFYARSALELKDFPSYKLILTGTPITKSVEDLNAQIKFLFGYDTDRTQMINNMETVKVRTTKDELGIKPIKPFKFIVELSDEQSNTDNILDKKIQSFAKNDWSISENFDEIKKIVMYKIMLSSNPFLLRRRMFEDGFPEEVIPKDYGAKIYTACELAREFANKNEKVVIWSFFRENIEIVDNLLKDIGSQYIHGGTDTGDIDTLGTRENIIREFKENPNKMVLVANPASAGEGISLHKQCHRSIYIDRTFNAAHFLQSRDRIHRLGLSKDIVVTETILEHENYIDKHVENNLQGKMDLMEEMLRDTSINPKSTIISSLVDYMSWTNKELEIGNENYTDMVDKNDILDIIKDTTK